MNFINSSLFALVLLLLLFSLVVDGEIKPCLYGSWWHRGILRPVVRSHDTRAIEDSFYNSFNVNAGSAEAVTTFMAKFNDRTWKKLCEDLLGCKLSKIPQRIMVKVNLEYKKEKVLTNVIRCATFSGIYLTASETQPHKMYVMVLSFPFRFPRIYQEKDISSIVGNAEPKLDDSDFSSSGKAR